MRNAVRVPFSGGVAQTRATEGPMLAWNSATCSVTRFPRYLSASTCSRIVELAARFDKQPGRMLDGDDHLRRNGVTWLAFQDDTRWLFDIVEHLFREANDRYRFDVAGFAEPLQLVDYGRGDHIDWHLDCTRRQTSTRKLVATVLLSNPASFAGGELEFAALREPLSPQAIGDALVFPAFLPHRVSPIRKGRRRTLVAWAHGAAFR